MDQTNDQTPPNTEALNQTPTENETGPDPKIEAMMARIKAAEEKAAKYEADMKAKEQERLRQNNEWQKIAEMKEKEADEVKGKYQKVVTGYAQREKYNALTNAALSAGLKKESVSDIRLLDFPEMKIETNEEGDISISGVEKALQRLKASRPHWFNSSTINVNASTPSATGGSGSNISWDQLKKAEAEWKKNPSKQNESAYREAMLAYKKAGA